MREESSKMDRFGSVSFAQRSRKALRFAEELYRSEPDWLVFFREVSGVNGIVHRLFPQPEMLEEFAKTAEYGQIQDMLGRLRQKAGRRAPLIEPNRVITIRLPMSVHEALIAEATNRGTSMNRLCISKLLQVLEQEFAGEAGDGQSQAEQEQPSRAEP
jgi:predicted HicB family RNase H-like nuclease